MKDYFKGLSKMTINLLQSYSYFWHELVVEWILQMQMI